MKDNAKNSTSKHNNKMADSKKTKISDKTECMGFRELITKNEKSPKKNKSKL